MLSFLGEDAGICNHGKKRRLPRRCPTEVQCRQRRVSWMARLNAKKLNSLGWVAQGRKEGRRGGAGGCSPRDRNCKGSREWSHETSLQHPIKNHKSVREFRCPVAKQQDCDWRRCCVRRDFLPTPRDRKWVDFSTGRREKLRPGARHLMLVGFVPWSWANVCCRRRLWGPSRLAGVRGMGVEEIRVSYPGVGPTSLCFVFFISFKRAGLRWWVDVQEEIRAHTDWSLVKHTHMHTHVHIHIHRTDEYRLYKFRIDDSCLRNHL